MLTNHLQKVSNSATFCNTCIKQKQGGIIIYNKILVFFDSHDVPKEDKSRFSLLGKLIVKEKPSIIVQGGDFATMDSLSRWDRDKRLIIEGKRVKDDLLSARESWKLVEEEISKEKNRLRKKKKEQYKPTLVWMEGNHEDWINSWIERNAELEGFINLRKELDINNNLFEDIIYLKYKDNIEFNGLIFTHIPMNRTGPISSKYIGSRAIENSNYSIVFGHTHRNVSDSASRYGEDGKLRYIRALNGGSFFDKWPHYAEGNNNDYWSGVILLHNYSFGKFDIEEWSLERMRNKYGA